MKLESEKYCHECGRSINAKAEICPLCGVRQPIVSSYESGYGHGASNQWLITFLLCWFLGVFGVHRFYTGHTGTGILMLITFGGCGIWWLIDFIMIIVGNFKDSDGNVIRLR
ncbi:MAG: hypothetical protein BGO30_10705 [Bacteroidetes bacterium 41-46]|nr:MAG: hypothetical protein BGO30_10705 [Bacteroidetes bacterium 41-46]